MEIFLREDGFPCAACGVCCRRVHTVNFEHTLNRGDGVCINFVEETNKCSIYAQRPEFCNIAAYYDRHYAEVMSWSAFVQLNLQVCEMLKKQAMENGVDKGTHR